MTTIHTLTVFVSFVAISFGYVYVGVFFSLFSLIHFLVLLRRRRRVSEQSSCSIRIHIHAIYCFKTSIEFRKPNVKHGNTIADS